VSALAVLERVAEHADRDETAEARTLLRGILRQASELADEDEGHVDDLLRAIGAAKGLGSIAGTFGRAIADRRKVVTMPGVEIETVEGCPSVTLALREAGCADVPDGLGIPSGYVVTSEMVWARYAKGEDVGLRPIGHGLLAVVGRAVDCDLGDVRVTLAWRYHARWVRVTVPRATALDGRKLIGLASMGCPVDGKSAPTVAVWLAMQEACMASSLEPAVSMVRPGWTPDYRAFLLGHRAIVGAAIYTPPGPGEEQRAAGYRESGTLDEWKRLIWAKCAHHPIALMLLASMVPPILPVLGVTGWTLDVGGASTTGKTTAAGLAASVWGDPDVVCARWPGTWSGVRSMLEQASHVPCILDDTKNVKGQPDLVKAVLYAAAFGRSQTLGQAGGGTQRERTISTVVISTGEAPAVSMCGDAQGATTRVISLRRTPLPPGSKAMAKALEEDAKAVHGTAGPAIVRWLANNRDKWPAIRESYRTFRDTIAAAASDDLEARASAYVAQLHVAAWVASAALGIEVPTTVITLAMECVREGAGDRDTALAALMWCAAWWDARPGMVWGSDRTAREVIGWRYDDGRRAWAESQLRRALSEGGYLWQEVLTAWRDRGWLEVQEPGRFSVKVSAAVDDSRPRGILWSAKAMERI
jgi:hypothetical protein